MKLLYGDCLEVMRGIPDGSVDAIITDPPYGTINKIGLKGWDEEKTSWDNIIHHKSMLDECNRTLRASGALVLFSQDPYTAKLITETHGNLPFSYRLIWLKDHFANCLLVKKAPVKYTEDICVYFKKYDTLGQHPLRDYSKQIMEYMGETINQINGKLGHRRAEHFFYIDSTQFGLCTEETYVDMINIYGIDKMQGFISFNEMENINNKFKFKFKPTFNLLENSKFKSNILEYKKDYMGLHPTQKPVALMEDLIKAYTNEGETVLDFTMGSGTTGVACRNTNRHFIGIEKEIKYYDIAIGRIADDT